MKRKICLIAIFLNIAYFLTAQSEQNFFAGKDSCTVPSIDLGIEVAELMQNSFSNLGLSNFTVIAGQRFWFNPLDSFGWRLLGINAALSSAHLADPATTIGLSGNRENLSGTLSVFRLYGEWYPGVLKAWFIRLLPILSAGLGWNRTVIINPRFTEPYDFSALSIALAGRIRFSFWNIVWLETPFMDIAFNLWKSGSASGTFGDLTIERPDFFSIFAWIGFGFTIPLVW